MPTLLAFDTATDRLSVALAAAGQVFTHDGEGGAQASAALLPTIERLLAESGCGFPDLDTIVFGRGPGAFTGLRTACAVAQGLGFALGKPVIPVDTLLAIAEDAGAAEDDVWAVLDARMNEIYAAHYRREGGRWQTVVPPFLTTAGVLDARWDAEPPRHVAGNALKLHPLAARGAGRSPDAMPRATALLALAPALRDTAVDAAHALPLYVREKVAQTTAERDAARAAKAAAA